MTDIERLAKEAGMRKAAHYTRNGVGADLHIVSSEDLAKFAALIAEGCAKVCEHLGDGDPDHYDLPNSDDCAAAIRSKFPMPKEGA